MHASSFGWARSCCDGDSDFAADVLQVAYVKVLSGTATFSGRSSFRTWFFGVIRFTAMESSRREKKVLAVPHATELYSSSPQADERLLEEEQTVALRRALASLPDRQREVLHLVFYQGMTVSEAAAIMQVSAGTASVHYDRGKRALRSMLSSESGDRGSAAAKPASVELRSSIGSRRRAGE